MRCNGFERATCGRLPPQIRTDEHQRKNRLIVAGRRLEGIHAGVKENSGLDRAARAFFERGGQDVCIGIGGLDGFD